MKKNNKFNIVIILSIFFLCLGFTAKTFQNDTFYTLKIGDFILKNGIDMVDHYSWIKNLPYTYPHWLYDCIISIIYNINGFQGIYLLNIVLYTIIGILIYRFSLKKTKNYLFSFILTIFTILFLSPFITARAQVFSFIIFILEEHFIENFLKDGKTKDAIAIIILSIILVNIHLATWIFFFVLFLPPIVSNYIGILVKKISKKKQDITIGRIEFNTNKNTKKLFLVIGICLLTGFLTPLGTTPYTYVFKQFAGNTFTYIIEYQKLNIKNCTTFYMYLLLVLVVFMLTREKVSLNDLFLMLGLILMSLSAIRSFAYLLIIGSFVVSNYISKLTKKLTNKTKNTLDVIFNRKSELITIFLSFLIGGTTLFTLDIKTEYVPERLYPSRLVNYIKENIDTKKNKIFNEYTIGSYLLYNDIPVFMDSRSDLYTKPFNQLDRDIFNDYVSATYTLNYDEVFEYYHITHIVFPNEVLLIKTLNIDPNYKEIYKDEYYSIYEKVN